MKTLKELKEKCTLLCNHKEIAFIRDGYNESTPYKNPNKCTLFTDNKGTYYLYKQILDTQISIYYNYKDAIEAYIEFIEYTCEN